MPESRSELTINMHGVLTETFRIANNQLSLILLFIILVNTPINLSRILIPWIKLSTIYGELSVRGLLFLFRTIDTLFWLFTTIGVSFIAQQSIDGKSPTLKSIFSFALSRFDAVVWTYLVQTLTILGRLLLLIIPGIIFANDSSFALTTSALRDKKGQEAIQYSEKLVHGQWWKIFWYQFLFFTFFLLVNGIIWQIYRGTRIDYFNDFIYLIIIETIGQLSNIWMVTFFKRAENSKGIPRQSDINEFVEGNIAV